MSISRPPAAFRAASRADTPGRNVLGAAVQLCTLPWLGFVPDEVALAPAARGGSIVVAARDCDA